jgi:hypothetical protein
VNSQILLRSAVGHAVGETEEQSGSIEPRADCIHIEQLGRETRGNRGVSAVVSLSLTKICEPMKNEFNEYRYLTIEYLTMGNDS